MKQRLEEVIDGAIARMAEPAWAPFRPGTSYFAPPRPAGAARWLLALLSRSGEMDLRPLRRGLSVDEAAPWPPPPAVTRVRPTSSTVSISSPFPCSNLLRDSELKHFKTLRCCLGNHDMLVLKQFCAISSLLSELIVSLQSMLLKLIFNKTTISHGEMMNMQATFLMRWRAQGWMMPIKLKRNEWKGYLWCGI
jgi:hypothetical protein